MQILHQEMQTLYQSKAAKGKRPWEFPAMKRSTTEGTIFDQSFLTMTFDELHEARVLGAKYYGVMRMFQQAKVKLGLTATPLLTSPKVRNFMRNDHLNSSFPQDISSLGRVLGVTHFLTEDSFVEEKEDLAAVRKARKMNDDGISIRQTQIETVIRMQSQFTGHILRRTAASLDWQGNPLLTLPPHKDIIGILSLTQREIDIIDERAEIAKARSVVCFPGYAILTFLSVVSGNESGKFLTRVRFMTFYPDPCV
jgi:hypothetical protein